MDPIFSKVTLADINRDVARNIVSLRESQDLFDDLSSDPSDWLLAQRIEDEVKPPLYRSHTPIIHRPFEEAQWFNVIAWPFRHWQTSRFSDGSYGVWYGSESVATTVYETAYHWVYRLLSDAGFQHENVVAERKVYSVTCSAVLLDFRPVTAEFPDLLHPSDYTAAQTVGARIHREGHPGIIIQSVRRPKGENMCVFNPAILSNPRLNCQLSYYLEDEQITVEKHPGKSMLKINLAEFG